MKITTQLALEELLEAPLRWSDLRRRRTIGGGSKKKEVVLFSLLIFDLNLVFFEVLARRPSDQQ